MRNGYLLLQPLLHLIRAIVVRGALVLVAPARPAMSFAFLYFFVPSTLTFTKVLCFVFPDLHDVLFCPAPVSASIHAYLL